MSKKDSYQISLKVILKNKKGEVLIMNGHPKGSFAGFYDLPGGRIDENEFDVSFASIIQRELKEEVGNVKILLNHKPVAMGRHLVPASLINEKKDVHVLYIFFDAKYVSGKIKISEEHIGFEWVNLKKIKLNKYFTSGILEGINMYLSK